MLQLIAGNGQQWSIFLQPRGIWIKNAFFYVKCWSFIVAKNHCIKKLIWLVQILIYKRTSQIIFVRLKRKTFSNFVLRSGVSICKKCAIIVQTVLIFPVWEWNLEKWVLNAYVTVTSISYLALMIFSRKCGIRWKPRSARDVKPEFPRNSSE